MQELPAAIILLVSGVMSIVYYLTSDAYYMNDSVDYIYYARRLAGLSDMPGPDVYRFDRPPLYPILLWLTGAAKEVSLIPLLGLQTLAAAFTPLLAYRLAARFTYWAGPLAGAIVLLSQVPYLYMKTILTDHLYIFLLLLALLLCSNYQYKKRLSSLFAAFAAMTTLVLLRPGTSLAPAAAAITLVFAEKRKALLVLAIGAAATVLPTLVSSSSSYVGKLIFFNVYLSSDQFAPGSSNPFRNQLGPATQELRNVVTRHLQGNEGELRRLYECLPSRPTDEEYAALYRSYENDPEEMAARMLAYPRLNYVLMMWLCADGILGPKKSDALFLKSGLEMIRVRPTILTNFMIRNLIGFCFYWGHDYSRDYDPAKPIFDFSPQSLLAARTHPWYLALFPASIASDLNAPLPAFRRDNLRLDFFARQAQFLPTLGSVVFVVTVLGLPFVLSGRSKSLGWLCLLACLAHLAPIIVFQRPNLRYLHGYYCVEIVLASGGAVLALQWLRRELRFWRQSGEGG